MSIYCHLLVRSNLLFTSRVCGLSDILSLSYSWPSQRLFLCVFQPSDFSVSLKAVGKNKHFKVQLSDGVYCIGQRRFNSMDELVEHYKKAPIFTSEHGERLYLVKALWFTHPRAYTGSHTHTYIQTDTHIHTFKTHSLAYSTHYTHIILTPLPNSLNSSLSSEHSCCGICTTFRSSVTPVGFYLSPSSGDQVKLPPDPQPSSSPWDCALPSHIVHVQTIFKKPL